MFLVLANLPKSALIMYLINGYKKSVETCHVYHASGIGKHHCKNKQKQIPHAVVYTSQSTAWAVPIQSYTNRMAVLRLYPLTWNFADFDAKDKARNAFLTRGFLPSDGAKINIILQTPSSEAHFLSGREGEGFNNIKYIWVFSEAQSNFFLRSKIKGSN